MKYERLWERLLEFLKGWSSATEGAHGRIEVTLAGPDGSSRVVEILMTPREWDEMVSIPFGDFTPAADEVRKSVLGLQDDEAFLVYRHCELVPSATAALPVDPEDVLVDELAREHPKGFGRWVALDPDGRVRAELNPPSA